MSEVYPETPLGSPTSGNAVPVAPELAAALAETRKVRGGYQELCEEFAPSPQSGMSARISLTALNRHRVRAGLPELPRARGEDREDVTMRYRRERDEARAENAGLTAQLALDMDRWPKCPDGCGCRLATGDADARECGCDGPCTMECRENGYPDAPSYRDLAVRHAMDERDEARAELQEVHDVLVAAYGRDDLTEGAEALLAGALASERDEAREQLAVQHEAMSQLRADHSENARLIAGNGRYRAALERILGRTGTDDRAVILAMRADARAALEPQ